MEEKLHASIRSHFSKVFVGRIQGILGYPPKLLKITATFLLTCPGIHLGSKFTIHQIKPYILGLISAAPKVSY